MSHDDIMKITGSTRLEFRKAKSGVVLAEEGDLNDRLLFFLKGSVRLETMSDDKDYCLSEILLSPLAYQVETIFGLNQRYTSRLIAETECSYFVLSKKDVMRLTDEILVFKINFLNIISARAQKISRVLWHIPPYDVQRAIVRFISDRCVHPAGEKTLKIKMVRLAAELGYSRMDISIAISQLVEKGLILHTRGMITVPALEQLIQSDR